MVCVPEQVQSSTYLDKCMDLLRRIGQALPAWRVLALEGSLFGNELHERSRAKRTCTHPISNCWLTYVS